MILFKFIIIYNIQNFIIYIYIMYIYTSINLHVLCTCMNKNKQCIF